MTTIRHVPRWLGVLAIGCAMTAGYLAGAAGPQAVPNHVAAKILGAACDRNSVVREGCLVEYCPLTSKEVGTQPNNWQEFEFLCSWNPLNPCFFASFWGTVACSPPDPP